MRALVIAFITLLVGCVGVPDGIQPVQPFEVKKYLGKWYEIARYDHSFERNMRNVTAEYTLRPDGGIKVVNRGYNMSKQKWKAAEGKAYFVGAENIGHLKVSFFGPFYGSYVVFSLDDNYEYALITSTDRSYFWLLSRHATLDATILKKLKQTMIEAGFDPLKAIWVEQSPLTEN